MSRFYGKRLGGFGFGPLPMMTTDAMVPAPELNTSPLPIFSPLTPQQAIVLAPTPTIAASIAAPTVSSTVPIIRDDALVISESIPPPSSLVSSPPADFPEYTIRPEVLGSPVYKGTVPGMYDPSSLISLFPSLTMSTPIDMVPELPQPVAPLPAPAPIIPILNSTADQKIQTAILSDQTATIHNAVANDLQLKADQAFYDANLAANTATMDPTWDAQIAAAAAAQRAENLQTSADLAANRAITSDALADTHASDAQVAVDTAAEAQAVHDVAYAQSVANADWHSISQALNTPGQVVPEYVTDQVAIPGFSISPLVAAGVAGVVGYFLGGNRGAAFGALLGGGGAYFMGQRQAQTVQAGPPPVPSNAYNYVGESFVPYQNSDGTWVVN